MSYRGIVILIFLLLGQFFRQNSLFAQVISEFPVQSGQYFVLQSAINPSTANLLGKTEAFAANLSNLGAFNNIKTLSFLFHQRINSRSDSNYHSIGLYAVSDQEGEFLHRNRGYASYSYHIRLNTNYYFSSGISLGIASLSAQGSSTTAGGSDIAPDGNLGISIHSEKMVLGISSNQLFNSKLQPIRQELTLRRHYNVFFKRKFSLSPYTNFIPMLQLRYPSFPFRYDLDLTGLIEIQNKVYAGITYKVKSRIIFNIGLDLPVIRNNHLSIFFSYHTASFSQASNLQAFEINVGYLLKQCR